MKNKRGALVWAGAVASVVLLVVWLFYATVNETPPYKFMEGAKQVGYEIVDGRHVRFVFRYYEMDARWRATVREADTELIPARGWQSNAFGGVIYKRLDEEIWLVPEHSDDSRTLLLVSGPTNGLERTVGRFFRKVPSWLER